MSWCCTGWLSGTDVSRCALRGAVPNAKIQEMTMNIIQHLVAHSNLTKILLLQQTMRTMQLKLQLEEANAALQESVEVVESLTKALLGTTETHVC